MRTLLILAVALFTLAAPARAQTSPTLSGRRVALVIGNGAYRNVDRLANSGNDAKLIAATLKSLNFTLLGGDAQLDLDRAHLAQSIADFGHAIIGADVALFYYSGHGLQVQGVNWLVPTDANPTRPQDLDFQMVDADLVLRQMDGAGTRLNIMLLDACRNNPFASRGLRALQPGLAEMRAPDGTLISYATQPGNVAMDGTGADSPYTTALAATMREPGLDIFRMFNRVGLQVKKSTDGSQQPWVSTSPIDGDFFFAPAATATAVAAPALAPQAAPPPPANTVALAAPPNPPQPAPPFPSSPAEAQPAAVDAVRGIVRGHPCSILDAKMEGATIDISGVAARTADWDAFAKSLGSTRGIRPGTPNVEFLPAFACNITETLADAVRRGRAAGTPRLLGLPRRELQAGQSVGATVREAAGKFLLADVYSDRGTVEHVGSSFVAGSAAGTIAGGTLWAAASATAPSGPRVLTVIVSNTPLNLGNAARTKETPAYLVALAAALRDAPDAVADITTFEVHPAPARLAPTAASGAAHAVQPSRCNSILERAQLGEPLSDADRAALRACR